MGQMTKIQFDTIRSLALAYGHEWAMNLDMARPMGQTGMTYRKYAMRYYANPSTAFADDYVPSADDLARCGAWRAWIALSDRVASGYVPTTEEVERFAAPLFEDDHYPSTPHVALMHETCTHRTRWRVDADGAVWFGFYDDRTDGRGMRPICEIMSYICRAGFRIAQVDCAIPVAQWGDEHTARIRRALASIGMSAGEIDRALGAARLAKLQWKRFGMVAIEDGQRRNCAISPWPTGDYRARFPSGIILSWDGDSIAVEQRWGASMGDDVVALARETWLVSWDYTDSQPIHTSPEPSLPPRSPVARRVVGGTRRRRNARRRVNSRRP